VKLSVVGNGAIGTLAAIYAKRTGGIDEVEIIGERSRNLSATGAAGAMINALAEVEHVSEDQRASQVLSLEFGLRGSQGWREYLESSSGSSCITAEDTLVVLKKRAFEFEESNFRAVLEATESEKRGRLVPLSQLEYLPGFRAADTEAVLRIEGEFALDSNSLLQNLDNEARNAGVRLVNAAAEAVDPDLQSIKLTNGQVISTDRILVASGASSSSLLPKEARVQEMFQGVGTALLAERISGSGPTLREVVRSVNRGGAQCGIHLVPRNDGGIYIGAGNHVTKLGAPQLRFDTVRYLLTTAERELLGTDLTYMLSGSVKLGLRPRSLDGLPLIGPLSKYPNVFFASATNRVGLTWAPEIARLFSIWLRTGTYDEAFSEWLPDREPVSWSTPDYALRHFTRSRIGNAIDHGLIPNDPTAILEKESEFASVAANLIAETKKKVGFVAPPDNWSSILS
jgi:glycine/D-amino acid oxidase-like deaminating enzyme